MVFVFLFLAAAPLGIDFCDHPTVLSDFQTGGIFADSVLNLGDLCRLFESWYLVFELRGYESVISFARNRSFRPSGLEITEAAVS